MYDLTALIACKNRDVNIQYCLQSISNCIYTPQTIVVDFGSDNSLKYLEKKYDFVKVIRTTRDTKVFHKARALNIGLKGIKTKYTCITDADQIFSRNFFKVVNNVLDRNNKFFVMCKTYFLKNLPEYLLLSSLKLVYDKLLVDAQESKIFHGDGCCNGFVTDLGKKINGYNEEYVGYGGEDSDFALRMELLGLKRKFINNSVTMIHLPHPKTGSYYSKQNLARNKKMYKKNVKERKVKANIGKNWGEL